MTKLSAPMMSQLRYAYGQQLDGNSVMVTNQKTADALIARGLLETDTASKFSGFYCVTQAGRVAACGVDIEALHAEALDENIERYPASQFPTEVWEQTHRMKARAGLYTWPRGMVALDGRDAHEMDRLRDEADIAAARLGFEAHSEALIEYATHRTSDAGVAARMLARAGLMEFPASMLRDDFADAMEIQRHSNSNRLHITGYLAADIRTYWITSAQWTEVRMLDECAYGCKLHGRRINGFVEYALMHSATYGCPLGRSEATAVVAVSVDGVVTRSAVEVQADEDRAQFDADTAIVDRAYDAALDMLDREAEMAGAYEPEYHTGDDEVEYADESDYLNV